jgi:hypothetical protein
MHAPVREHRQRVVDVVRALREADEGDDALGLARDGGQRLAGVAQEVLLEQEVLGRIAGEGELGEQHDLRAGVAGARDVVADLARVALEIADARVDLGERETQRWRGGSGHASSQSPGGGHSSPRASA